MSALTSRAAATVITALTATVVAACSHPTATATSSTRPATTTPAAATSSTAKSRSTAPGEMPTYTTAPLTDGETLWLASFTRMEMTLTRSLQKLPAKTSPSSMVALADALRGCGSTLTRIGVPSQHLQPVYRLAQQECAAYDRAAPCLETLAAIPSTLGVGSADERKLSQATDCVTAGMRDGDVAMENAVNKSIEIKAASGDI